MENNHEKTVADFVTENIKSAHIFKKYGIDFCCGGNISLEQACVKKKVDFKQITKDLESLQDDKGRHTQYDQWNIAFLADHIINIHHKYVKESIPILKSYADKVYQVHGQHFEELQEIRELLNSVSNELMSHMQKEEMILFPYIKSMMNSAEGGNEGFAPLPLGSVNQPIRIMLEEHENAGNILAEIAELTNNFTAPEEACNTFRALFAGLEEFQDDLHLHVHLENNILFPKAIALEKKLIASV